MCWCRPNVRTPNCGRIECIPPKAASTDLADLRALAKEMIEQSDGWCGPTASSHYRSSILERARKAGVDV